MCDDCNETHEIPEVFLRRANKVYSAVSACPHCGVALDGFVAEPETPKKKRVTKRKPKDVPAE
jgi:hypothetical protein